MARALRQADLARQVGISPSYLNLIEHNRRGIGGKLLVDIARVLDVEPGLLTRGAEAALVAALQAAADREVPAGDAPRVPAPERERSAEFAARLPGWARLVTSQAERIAALEETVMSLSDRLTHDPFLAETMHDILSSVAAVRSTATILAETPDIDPTWQQRFQRNLVRDARRLSETSAALLSHFDRMSQQSTGFATAPEALAAFVAAAGYHFPAIEAGTRPEEIVADDPLLSGGPEQALALACLRRYAADAARLPLAGFAGAARALDHAPAALAERFGVPLDMVLRRLAALPARDGEPDFGLVCCDGSGTLTLRKPVAGFPLPRFGAACPLWPLYQALIRPALPVQEVIETPESTRFLAHAICLPSGSPGFDGAGPVEATMLFRHLPGGTDAQAAGPVRPVGIGCRVCARAGCRARREPSILRELPEPDA